MAMTTAQVTAFKTSTGGIAPGTILTAVTLTLAIIYLLWMAWIAYSQLRSWQTGQGTFYDLIFTVIRAAIVAMLIGYTIN